MRQHPRLRLRLAAASLSAAAMLSIATPSFAHDHLIRTAPAEGAVVAVVPAQVVLTFAEPALTVGSQVLITGPAGRVDEGPPALVETTVTQALGGGSPAGAYTVVWRVTSIEGHPISGTVHFTARQASPPAARASSASSIDTAANHNLTPDAAQGPVRPVGVWAGLLVSVATAAFILIRIRRRTAPTA